MTFELHINGIVQGVGFRPAMYQAALQIGIKGTVCNTADGVHILFNATGAIEAAALAEAFIAHAPANSRIVEYKLQETTDQTFTDFSISQSANATTTSVMLAPDYAMCATCRAELHDDTNRRFQYAFTTCTACGPRYSITAALPYDRHLTSMDQFTMCSACGNEYANPLDRRFYSQTNSCPACGISLLLYNENGLVSKNDDALAQACAQLKAGQTVAVKGIGGYLLLCDATNAAAVQRLRERKHRPSKPFAVLYPNVSVLAADMLLSEYEQNELTSAAAPIVLLKMRPELSSQLAAEVVAPSLHSLGAMLPYAPLLDQIAATLMRPLVATSANISRAPIVYQDEVALRDLFSVTDAILLHNRQIVIPQDDSVVRFTRSGRRIVVRRSRGFAPTFFNSPINQNDGLLALGAHMKSTVSLCHQGNVYVSQYIGDLESAETENVLAQVTEHLLKVTGAQPDIVLADRHPEYASTQMAKRIALERNLPLMLVQHHKAHFAAVLAEHDLPNNPEPVMGVVWDGVGLGEDGKMWGGEFFILHQGKIDRAMHWSYFPLLLGDKMAREPRLAALSLTRGKWDTLSAKFTEQEWNVYNRLLEIEKVYTSSAGRLFDAVASILGLCDKATYEGEGALLLENLAADFFDAQPDFFDSYPRVCADSRVDSYKLIRAIVNDIDANIARDVIAAKFHCTLVTIIQNVALIYEIHQLAFSGGVFQNAVLVELIEKRMSHTHTLYFHEQLSPNDECISFGQLAWYHISTASAKAQQQKTTNTLLTV